MTQPRPLMFIVDAHLDLAYNAVRGRDLTLPAQRQQPDEQGIPSVGLPDLRAGGVGLICATIFCQPVGEQWPGYRTPAEAREMALRQMAWYVRQHHERQLRLMHFRGSCELPVASCQSHSSQLTTPHAILLLEGADPIISPDDLRQWHDAGLWIVGLAWKRTRYAGGTGAPGPLTAEGLRLVAEIDKLAMIHDASHLADESFWQLLERASGPVIASHSNCRQIVPTDRQLSDEMIRALVARGGVVGINFYDKFLLPPREHGRRRATLADVVRHVRHVCDLAGDALHVGLGTDMDGGLGRDQIPVEILSSADLPRVAEALAAGGFGDADVAAIMGENWMRFFGERCGGHPCPA